MTRRPRRESNEFARAHGRTLARAESTFSSVTTSRVKAANISDIWVFHWVAQCLRPLQVLVSSCKIRRPKESDFAPQETCVIAASTLLGESRSIVRSFSNSAMESDI